MASETDKLHALAPEDTFLNAYSRWRVGDSYDRELITFEVGNETYAIDIRSMREILRPPPVTEVPRTPPFVLGVVTVRGTVVPALDMRVRLGLDEHCIVPSSRLLIAAVHNEPYALLVDRVRNVVRLRDTDIEPTPALGGSPTSDFLAGLGRCGDQLLILLDLPAVITFRIAGPHH